METALLVLLGWGLTMASMWVWWHRPKTGSSLEETQRRLPSLSEKDRDRLGVAGFVFGIVAGSMLVALMVIVGLVWLFTVNIVVGAVGFCLTCGVVAGIWAWMDG